jgi:hypothetical protein
MKEEIFFFAMRCKFLSNKKDGNRWPITLSIRDKLIFSQYYILYITINYTSTLILFQNEITGTKFIKKKIFSVSMIKYHTIFDNTLYL